MKTGFAKWCWVLALPLLFLTACGVDIDHREHAYYDNGYYYRDGAYRDGRWGRVRVEDRPVIIRDGRRVYVHD